MVLKKKVVESVLATGLLVVVTTTTAVTGHVVSNMSTNTNIVTTSQVQEGYATAGIIQELNIKQISALASAKSVSIKASEVNMTVTANAGVTKAVAATIVKTDIPSSVSVAHTDATITGAAPEVTENVTAKEQTQVASSEQTATPAEASSQQASTDTSSAQPQTADTTALASTEQTATSTQAAAPVQTETTAPASTQQPSTTAASDSTQQPSTAASQNASSEATVVQNTDIAVNSDSVNAQLAQEETQWANKLMPNVDQFLNVRASADNNSAIVGKLYKGDSADVVEKSDTWTHIKSGDVDGYVMNQYCVFGTDAYNYAKQTCETDAKANTGGLRLRTQPSDDASIVDLIAQGQVMTVSKDATPVNGWITVTYDNQQAYVSSQYVSVNIAVGKGITTAEEQAQQDAEQADKAQKAAKAVQKSAVAASTDDVSMLAAVIQLEAGGEPYEGKVAVGSVVMNRVRSGRYAGSISGVIYQNGQFSTAGSVAAVATRGASASCRQAAQEAINGTDNTGGCISFQRASSGHSGLVIGNHVFF